MEGHFHRYSWWVLIALALANFGYWFWFGLWIFLFNSWVMVLVSYMVADE